MEGARVATVDVRGDGRIDLVLVQPSGTTRCRVLTSAGSQILITAFGDATSSTTVGQAPAGVAAFELLLSGRGRAMCVREQRLVRSWLPTDESWSPSQPSTLLAMASWLSDLRAGSTSKCPAGR